MLTLWENKLTENKQKLNSHDNKVHCLTLHNNKVTLSATEILTNYKRNWTTDGKRWGCITE